MKKTILFLLVVVGVWSCKKDKETKDEPAPTVPITYANYSNLKIGNYWVYERFILDTNGVYTSQNIFDSSFVDKDTVMNGNTYYKLNFINYPFSNTYVGVYLRDSLSFLINNLGSINFSSENFTDTFSSYYKIISSVDTIAFVFTKMNDNNLSVAVPAGTFITKNCMTTYLIYPIWAAAGAVRSIHNRYAENVGLVEETLIFLSSDPNYTVRRLKRYGHI